MATMDPRIDSFVPPNIFAMIRALVNNNCPILTIDGVNFPVTNGVNGTYANIAGKGTTLIDYTNGVSYINTGVLGNPVWSVDSGPVSAPSGMGSVGNAKMTYDFTVSGGLIGTITPVSSPVLPLGAIVMGGVIDNTLIPVGVGASIGLGFGSGAQVASLLTAAAISGAPWSTTGLKAVIPVFTAATMVKLTAAAAMTLTISAANLTAGKFDVNIQYVIGN